MTGSWQGLIAESYALNYRKSCVLYWPSFRTFNSKFKVENRSNISISISKLCSICFMIIEKYQNIWQISELISKVIPTRSIWAHHRGESINISAVYKWHAINIHSPFASTMNINKCHLPLLLAPTLPTVTDALTWLILYKLFITI